MTPLRSVFLDAIPWAEHGFGTRHSGAWTPLESTASLRQVHSACVVEVGKAGFHGEGDALITAAPGVWLEIRTADCVPLLIADPVRRVVAAVHAGWRGTAAGIGRKTVDRLIHDWKSNPADLQVAIGPCIAACCFEVGEDVAAHFPDYVIPPAPPARVDLINANRDQLAAAGVPSTQVESLDLCTVCNAVQFHSFRRERSDGRMVTAIRIRPAD